MIRVSGFRDTLALMDAIYEFPPEETRPGEQHGVSTLWPVDEPMPVAVSERAPFVVQDHGATPFEELVEFGPLPAEDEVRARFGGETGAALRKSVEVKGVDALGYYVSFHAKGAQWGIYLKAARVDWMASEVLGDLRVSFEERRRIAMRLIHAHEMFHFAVDYMSSQWELITEHSVHRPARALRDPRLGYDPREEALANAHMLMTCRRGPRVPGLAAAVRAFVKQQPQGYRDAAELLKPGRFDEACEALSRAWQEEAEPTWLPGICDVDHLLLFPRGSSLDWRLCPIFLVHDESLIQLPSLQWDLFRATGLIQHTPRFDKQLARLPMHLQERWPRTKSQLEVDVSRGGLGFKCWERKGDVTVYSARLDRNYRVHVEHRPEGWFAVSVGTHTSMGHD